MKVDKGSLKSVLQNVEEVEKSNFDFAVGIQVDKDNVLPMLSVEGLGTIPVPVSIKDLNRLKKLSDTGSQPISNAKGKVKKTCWQVDAGPLYRHGETAEIFFWQTIPSLAADGLRQLAFDESEIPLVEARPKHMLICERGGSYPLQRNHEQDPGMFATMVLQIPVKNGYSGGCMNVKHRDQTRVFDHSNGSNQRFFTTIYYAGCEHELTEVSHGWRFVLVFSLSWKWSRSSFMPLPGDQSIVSLAKEIERLLSPWLIPDDAQQQRLLALPLDHSYTKTSLSFSGLKGRDRLTASLLRSVHFVDVHLAGIRRRHTERWIAASTDSNFNFHGLEIDFEREVILPLNHKPTDNETELYSPYDVTMLVIWPRTSTIDFACRFGFVGALDHLEFLVVNLPREEVLYVLGRTVAYCCAHPRCVQGGDVTYRLLQLCIDLRAPNQGLILLNLLADDLPPKSPKSHDNEPLYEGIQTRQVAIALGKLIYMAGWNSCYDAIDRLLTRSRIAAQLGPMTCLVISLMDHELVNNAVEVANRVCPILFSSSWNPSIANSAAEMIFRMEEWTETSNAQRVNCFICLARTLETEELCSVLLHIYRTLPELVKRITDTQRVYLELCHILVRRHDLVNMEDTSIHHLVDIIKCLLWFDDNEILQLFLRQLTMPRKENNSALEAIVASSSVWNMCSATLDGQRVLQILVDCRLRELSLLKPPVFSWEQPDAVIPNYPEVEEFLHSNQLSTTFSRKFANVSEASEWAIEVFGNGFNILPSPHSPFFKTNHYSATVHVKKIAGGLAVCDITKNRRYFEYTLRQFELRQRELVELIERRTLESATQQSRPVKRVKFDLP